MDGDILDAVDLNLWLSVSFFKLFSLAASLHMQTVLETHSGPSDPLPSVQSSVAALLRVLLQADDQLEVVGGVLVGQLVLDVGATTHLRLGQHEVRACFVLHCSHLK